MEKWPLGVFASIDAGLGVRLEVVRELGVPTIQLHAPSKPTRTKGRATEFLARLDDFGIRITVVFGGFEGDADRRQQAGTMVVDGIESASANQRLDDAAIDDALVDTPAEIGATEGAFLIITRESQPVRFQGTKRAFAARLIGLVESLVK